MSEPANSEFERGSSAPENDPDDIPDQMGKADEMQP
jgi:hypothetical protein